ncbi:MAG: APC family permease [Rickettsiales bacterium]|nr:APC family permease [Rickettsiales bacterium]
MSNRPAPSSSMRMQTLGQRLSHALLGPPRDPLRKETRQHLALAAFLAWVGLGADGLSSACYGPEEAFVALGSHTELGIFLAIATAITVIIISLAYSQVIELFPDGGGGYRVASTLIGPKAGLVAGSALIVDYVLTIAISVASGTDALFSALPHTWQPYKLVIEALLIIFLGYLNLRGMKESIKILMPVFMCFVVSHVFLIMYGIFDHASGLGDLVPNAVTESNELSGQLGMLFVVSLFLKAFSLGGGTYTGIEAVSNNVHTLAQPRVRTGRWTMFLVAISLSFMAAGIIILYLLWDVSRVPGETLNATTFRAITYHWQVAGYSISSGVVAIVMLFEAGLLLVAANSGFLAGPAVLANMANDRWVPHFFSALSSRLVTRNGVVLMALAAIAALFMTNGKVHLLVILYSINVFLTFSLSLYGLCVHWVRGRKEHRWWLPRLVMSGLGLVVCVSILGVTTVEKFTTGAWMTIIITSVVILTGYAINRHYRIIAARMSEADELFAEADTSTRKVDECPPMEKMDTTAVILVSESYGNGMHTLLWLLRLFPGVFKNILFLGVGEIGSEQFAKDKSLDELRKGIKGTLKQLSGYCVRRGIPSSYFVAYGTDVVDQYTTLVHQVIAEFPRAVFFGSKLIFDNENIITQTLHNQTAYILQRRLHRLGRTMVILPMKA